jgi:23S rRNA pseudoU1915 N3-methylase RlmH
MKNGKMILASCALALVAVGATIYKWVDEKGVTHYSETPPPGQKSQEIEVRPVPRADAESASASRKSWQERDVEFQKRYAERLEAEKKETQVKEITRRLDALAIRQCARAREDLEILKNAARVYKHDEKGEGHYMDAAERAREIKAVEEEIRSVCPSP